eukprot:1891100-Prymnesium_polylepis.2
MAVYMDDMMSGWTIENNSFEDNMIGAWFGGGRDHIVRGNHFERCDLGIHWDNRGVTWERGRCFCDDRCDPRIGKHCDCDPGAVEWLTGINPEIAARWPAMLNLTYQGSPAFNRVENNSFCNTTTLIDAPLKNWHSTETGNIGIPDCPPAAAQL